MRVLVQLPFPGYLRIYGSTVRMLADRGHEVLLSYDRSGKGRDPSAAAVEAHDRIELVPALPAADRRFERQVGDLRAAADYLRYLDPRFANAPYLRRRLERSLNGPLKRLKRVRYGHPLAGPAFRTALSVERLVPSDRRVEQAIAAHSPDLVFVSPLLGRSNRNRRQTDTVKASRRLGIPVGAGIASWDHLTTKGVVKAVPDRLYVWNEIQREEACELHRVPRARVVVTGAQLFDGWFDRAPTRSREELLASLGLDRSARVVLYVGSSPNIAPCEIEVAFVRRWLEALRAEPSLSGLVVLVRPHPYSVGEWAEVDLGAGAEVVPRVAPALPMTTEDDALYYDSINAASAVVGINTSAMVETFIQRRAVLTVRAPEFRDTQEGTLHFRHLAGAGGGALQTAASLGEHVAQLSDVLADPDGRRGQIEEFLRVFVRPRGLDRPATQILVEELEGLAARRPHRAGFTSVTPAARARRLLRDAQEKRRAAFFRRAGRWTPYVAAQLGEEVFVVRTGEEGLQRGLFVRQSRSDISGLERVLSWLDNHGVGRPADPVFVDVGANIGTTTVSALRRFGFASAVALEPSPENFRGLRLNLVANDVEERVTALQVAAATQEGTRPLDTDRRHSGGHRLARKGKAEKAKEGRIEVRVVTLDGLVRDGVVDPAGVGLLWVDAAGDEGKVICGATRLLERGVPIVAALRPRRMKPEARKALVAALAGYRFVDTAGLHPGATAHGIDRLEAVLASGPRTLDLLFVKG